jgi:hypothetical protein
MDQAIFLRELLFVVLLIALVLAFIYRGRD